MHIAIVNDDTRWGPRDPSLARLGAASLAPEYLARALAARGHTVTRVSPCADAGQTDGVRHVPFGTAVAADAAILSRNRYLAGHVDAPVKLVWTGDEHNVERWEDYPDVLTVCVSHTLADAVGRRVPVAAVVPNGVPDSLLSIPVDPARRRACYTCGVWDPCRGVVEGIRAFRLADDDEAVLHLYGDARLWGRKEGDAYAEDVEGALRIVSRWERHGTVSHVDMLAALPSLGILIHPATSETCGVAVTEAMAAGIPVVTTGCSALAELGVSVHCPTPEAAAEELERLLAAPAYYAAVAHANRERVRSRAWSRVAAAWDGLLSGRPLGERVEEPCR